MDNIDINFRIAVKAFIVKDNKILVIKRRSNDVHKPNEWDIPGGRLDLGEDPNEGVKRETLEEVKLHIEPLIPLHVQHFTRDDGQLITMIIFLCKADSHDLELSPEHQEHNWVALTDPVDNFPGWLHPVVKNYRTYIKHLS